MRDIYRTAIILINHNGAEDTAECIKSLQVNREFHRIVVVDNTPYDPGIAKIVDEYPYVHLIRMTENVGFGRGNNVGIRWVMTNTDCEFIFLLNNDATYEAGIISLMERTLDEHQKIGIAAPRIVYYHDPDMLWYGGGEISWARGSVKLPGFRRSARSEIAMKEREVSFASGCAMFIRCKVLNDVGGFDPRFFMYEEDVELCLRVRESGWKIRYLPYALVRHKVQGGNSQGNAPAYSIWSPNNPKLPFYIFHLTKNRLLNMFVHSHGVDFLIFILLFPVLWSKKILEFLCFRRFDGIAAVFKGVVSFLRDIQKPYINELRM